MNSSSLFLVLQSFRPGKSELMLISGAHYEIPKISRGSPNPKLEPPAPPLLRFLELYPVPPSEQQKNRHRRGGERRRGEEEGIFIRLTGGGEEELPPARVDEGVGNEEGGEERGVAVGGPPKWGGTRRHERGGVGEDEVVHVGVPDLHVGVLPLAVRHQQPPKHGRDHHHPP